jgi:hypothetical protein
MDFNPPTATLPVPKTATRPAVSTIQLKNRNIRFQERGESKGGFVDLGRSSNQSPNIPITEKPKITMHRKVPKQVTVKYPPQVLPKHNSKVIVAQPTT